MKTDRKTFANEWRYAYTNGRGYGGALWAIEAERGTIGGFCTEADAKLAACAPRMLSVLQECADYFHDFTEHDHDEARLAGMLRLIIGDACNDRPLPDK